MVFLHVRDEWIPVTQVLQLDAIESSIEVCMLVTYQKGIVLLSSCLNEVLGNFA